MLRNWILFLIILFFSFIDYSSAQIKIPFSFDCNKSIDFLKNNCYYCGENFGDEKCKVEKFDFLGSINGRYFYYGVYHLGDSSTALLTNYNDYERMFIVIFEGERNNNNLKPIHILSPSESYTYYNPPLFEFENTKYGIIIHIILDSGNGHWDEGEYILFRNDSWNTLEVPEFYELFTPIIPKGYWFCKGSLIDLKKMIIDFDVYKKDDPCCCPTGGTVIATLRITKDNKLVVSKSKYLPKLK